MNPISFPNDLNSLYSMDAQPDSLATKNTSITETSWETSTLDRFRSESNAYTWNVDEWDSSIDYLTLEKEADAAMTVSDECFKNSDAKVWHFEAVEEMYARAAYAAEKAEDFDKACILQQKRAELVEVKLGEREEAVRVLEKSADLYASVGREDLANGLYLQAAAVCDRWYQERSIALDPSLTEPDSFDLADQNSEKVEILLKKAQILEKLGEDAACKTIYKQAADILMRLEEGFFESTITPFGMAGFCYEKAEETQLAREAFQKEFDLILPWLDDLENDIANELARIREQRDANFGSESEDYQYFYSFEILMYSRIAREVQLCAVKMGDRDLFMSLLEKEHSHYKACMDFSSPEHAANLDSEISDFGLIFAAEYLSLSEFLGFTYEAVNPEKAAQIEIEAAAVKEQLEDLLSKREIKELAKLAEKVKENLKQLFSSDNKSIDELIDLLNFIEL